MWSREIADAQFSVGILPGGFKFPLRCGSRRSIRLDEDERNDKNFCLPKSPEVRQTDWMPGLRYETA